MERYTPAEVWGDFRMMPERDRYLTLDNLKELADKYGCVFCYRKEIYDDAEKIPFVREYSTTYTYCFPTGSVPKTPTVTILPKGTTIEKTYTGYQFNFTLKNEKQ